MYSQDRLQSSCVVSEIVSKEAMHLCQPACDLDVLDLNHSAKITKIRPELALLRS
jgi:hypothetical protein